MDFLNKAIRVLILICSITVMQFFSAKFWMDMVGNDIFGILLSVVVALITVLLWFDRKYWYSSVGSAVIVSTSLLHLSIDSIDKLENNRDNRLLTSVLVTVNDTLKKSDANGHYKTRQKSLDAISSLATTFKRKPNKSKDEKPPKKEADWFIWGKIIAQALGLIFIHAGEILIVLSISPKINKTSSAVRTKPKAEPKKEEKKELSELSEPRRTINRTTQNHEYSQEHIDKCHKVLAELESERSRTNHQRGKFMTEVIKQNKNIYSKIEAVVDGKKGGIGAGKLEEIQLALTKIQE